MTSLPVPLPPSPISSSAPSPISLGKRKASSEEPELDEPAQATSPNQKQNKRQTKELTPKPKPTVCQTCFVQPWKYTCPRCGHVSCSLACSKAHKEVGFRAGQGSEQEGCSGVRNKASYVEMKSYGWGEMMNDYTFLEEVGRAVKGVGEGIVRGGYDTHTSNKNHRDSSSGRGRGAGMRGGIERLTGKEQRERRNKRGKEVLRRELEKMDIGMELAPVGMERARSNKSVWDFKKQTPLLTIELVFYPPLDPLLTHNDSGDDCGKRPHRMWKHRVSLDETLSSLWRVNNKRKDKEKNFPEWVVDIIGDAKEEEEDNTPDCVLRAPFGKEKVYWRLDARKKIGEVLRWTEFVEFPTVEVYEKGGFTGKSGEVEEGEEQRKKKRVMGKQEGKERISMLIGEYGSEEEEGEGEEGGLGLGLGLDGYEDSGEDMEEEVEVDPKKLLEMLKKRQDDDGNDSDSDVLSS
ncbi:hypothetical protein K435DRAFT_773876 [Dendrothele bispora CBS 962.96]|uniref:HIT-type domain-containing protein n=1 Tax=Dendrothele bispora (strain CBS 962.96) TaxID=1314807 RepID=A0A4S8MR74_DENBC|nr:hypothetical protein K435DRAFT_773876 [Dendrothele bispora CBS 962.96]